MQKLNCYSCLHFGQTPNRKTPHCRRGHDRCPGSNMRDCRDAVSVWECDGHAWCVYVVAAALLVLIWVLW